MSEVEQTSQNQEFYSLLEGQYLRWTGDQGVPHFSAIDSWRYSLSLTPMG